ncbi:MAG: hypothetical protein ACHQ52_12315 [Candidatus Eisenbacteria bacterium]
MNPGVALRRGLLGLLLVCGSSGIASAASPVPVVFGTSWDGPGNDLQSIVDARYGPGLIDVQHDYMGAHAADPDPWFWVGDNVSALFLRAIAGNASRNVLGWYIEPETFALPGIDGVDDGVVWSGAPPPNTSKIVTFDHPARKFGFYLDPNGPADAPNAPQPERFYTNRFYNDIGPDGSGAVHPPLDGDVQALVFDVSRFTQPNTWLVCFEDLDSGPNPTPCCTGTDNDFNDLIFEVHALGATPTALVSFGALKLRYR